MDRLVRWFIKASLIYFAIGVGLGIAFVTFPALQNFIHEGPGSLIKWVHVHINLLGWVSLALAGAIYWLVPRLSGGPIHSERLGYAHFWLANIGLVGVSVLSLLFGYAGGQMYRRGIAEGQIYGAFTGALIVALVFAFVELAAVLIFVYNIWRSLSRAAE